MKFREIGTGILAIGASLLVQTTTVGAQDKVARLLDGSKTPVGVLPSDTKFSTGDTQRVLTILENFTGSVGAQDKEKLFTYLKNVASELEQIKEALKSIDIKTLGLKIDGELKIFPVKIDLLVTDIDFFIESLHTQGSTLESVLIKLELIFSKSGNQWVMKTIISKYPDFFKKPILSQTFKSIHRGRYERYSKQSIERIVTAQARPKVPPQQVEVLPWQATVETPPVRYNPPPKKSFFENLFGL